MIQSMTGYAIVEISENGHTTRIHLKSFNNRYFDLKWRAPRSWSPFEIKFKNLLKQKFERGSFDFWTEELNQNKEEPVSNSQNYFLKLNETLRTIKGINKLQIPTFVQATILSRNPDLWLSSQKENHFQAETIEQKLNSLIEQMFEARCQEGKMIKENLKTISSNIRRYFNEIQKALPIIRDEFTNESKKRLNELFQIYSVNESEQSKIASEIAILTDRRDCCEEVQRIEMHLQSFDLGLEGTQSHPGKRLDFIAQELNREWTTLGSKLRQKEIFQLALEAKLDIEKIREQCLNLA